MVTAARIRRTRGRRVGVDAELDELVAFADRGMAVAWHAARHPAKPALVSAAGTVTFGELNGRANRVARALRRRGLRPGDAVALLCSNRAEFVEVLLATQRSGLRLTTVNWHLTGDEAGYIVDDCEAKALIAEAHFAETARRAAAGALDATTRLAVGGSIEGFDDYAAASAAEAGEDLAEPVLGAQMLYTSGTTGRPKGVHREASLATAVTLARQVYRDGNVHLLTGPLYHAAPLLFSLNAPLVAGVPVVIMASWEPEEALRLIERHRVTHTHMVPTMFHQLLALPDGTRSRFDVSSLRHVLHGAAPCPVGVKQRVIDWLGPVVYEYYAATEGLGTWVDPATWLRKPGTVGKPVPDDQVVVGDEDANRLPAGEIGLVWLKAPETAPFEYFKDRAKTESSYIDRYFTLGDMGYIDEEGFLFLTDRSANLIISGGVNIYPAEVDAVLLEHPAVADAAVIGVPNDEWGEEVLAVIEVRAGVMPTPDLADELVTFCRGRLAHFKCPRRVEFVDRLPRQDNGKIYKRLLRDRYRERAAT